MAAPPVRDPLLAVGGAPDGKHGESETEEDAAWGAREEDKYGATHTKKQCERE
jgi:hypothetical protein